MKKIPTLFERIFENGKVVGITDKITPGCEEAFYHGIATIKWDGACCAIINGEFYKRYDAKHGKTPPEGAIPCCDPDPVTGHWPHWVKVDPNNPNDKWFTEAYNNHARAMSWLHAPMRDGTYEAVGPHFNGNPYGYVKDFLYVHGVNRVDVTRDFKSIKQLLTSYWFEKHEGLVFWLDGEPVCKIKRTDFGLPWPVKRKSE